MLCSTKGDGREMRVPELRDSEIVRMRGKD